MFVASGSCLVVPEMGFWVAVTLSRGSKSLTVKVGEVISAYEDGDRVMVWLGWLSVAVEALETEGSMFGIMVGCRMLVDVDGAGVIDVVGVEMVAVGFVLIEVEFEVALVRIVVALVMIEVVFVMVEVVLVEIGLVMVAMEAVLVLALVERGSNLGMTNGLWYGGVSPAFLFRLFMILKRGRDKSCVD